MRLHHLEITAFGPFADTVGVDFDELSLSGLFLLCGPTGAGKTSVLDAVCFALYGDVPGDRGSAKRLRCDTAPAGRAPRVLLDLTLSGRRFRITRSPSWTRPKKRGSGATTEQASVLVEERIEGAWVALSNRLDEAGHLLGGLVGMTMPQFCQVALLPQGRFQEFLRARSEERHKLLQQLFSTQRFEDIERWLRDRSRVLHRTSLTHQRTVSDVTSRLLESSATSLPDGWDPQDLAPLADSGELRGWATATVAGVVEDALLRKTYLRDAAARESSDRTALDSGRRLAGLLDRHAAAVGECARLEAAAPAQAQRRARIDAARRAAPVAPLHQLFVAADQRRERALAEAASAVAEVRALLGDAASAGEPLDLERLRDLTVTAETRVREAEALVPRQRELGRLEASVSALESEVASLVDDRTHLEAIATELPARVTSVRLRVEAGRDATLQLTAQREHEATLLARLDAHDRLAAVVGELAQARPLLESATTECLELKEAWLDLREARLIGMAAEIAGDLAVGDTCPVCGSGDHPHKAVPAPGAPDAVAEKAARSRLDDAELTRTALDAKVHELRTRQALLSQAAGRAPRAEVEADLVALRELLARLQGAADSLPADERALAEAESSLATHADDLIAVREALAAATQRLHTAREELAATERHLRDALDEAGSDSLDTLLSGSRRALEVLRTATARAVALDHAVSESARAGDALHECLAGSGFADVSDALAARLAPEAIAREEEAASAHDEALAGARSALEDPDVRAAAEHPRPDLTELERTHLAAADELAAAQLAARGAEQRSARLAQLDDDLGRALAAWAPVRAEHAVASELASFVEGKSADNELKMRLSAYVLAWRLTQVVAAANERLVRMTDQRYSLEHTGRRGTGESRGGLSLLVRDEWSGEARDPATLSGGETFVVSLALALGLADVVTQEAGGADLDTLFVDEGFGALDADTLDDVMDTLDTLRDGGRVVGVVSHVAELRTRIPTRLVVSKDRSGSTLSLQRAYD